MDAAVKASAWRAPVSVPALLDLVLAILLLLAIACVVQWRSADTFRKILPVAATGSPAAANFDPRSENPINTLFNRYGDFAAEDAGGMGRIVYDFGEPRAFNTVSHHYRMPAPDPWYHITAITVAVSADGLRWTDVAREETSSRAWMEAITERMVDERQAARLDASRIVLDTQHAVASRYWRLTASGSGAHRIDIFGQVQFMPDLSTVERIPLEAFAVLFGLACYRAARRLNITWGRAAAIASACAVSALLIVLALGFAPHWLLLTQDSATYISYTLDGSISPWVPSGYPRFVALVSALFGLSAMPTVQVLMLCIGMAIGAILLFEHSAVAPYVFLVGFLAVCGGIILYAFTALTEVMFAAGLVLATAALAVAIDRPAKAAFALVGLGLTLTLLAKSAAPILIAGACLALRYLPLAAWRSFALLAILPPSVVLLATYAEIYARTGDTSQLGPIALVGQVAAYADPDAGKALAAPARRKRLGRLGGSA
jgi:hypothetical protein